MGVLRTILLVAFVIVCVLLVLLVLVQNDEGNGMGSAFGNGQSAAFGAHQASVLTKTTGVLAALFFIVAFGLGLLNKSPSKEDLGSTAARVQKVESTSSDASASWLQNEINSESAAEETTVESAE